MVDLPSIPTRQVTVRAPESRVSASQIASPYMELAQTLELASRETGEFAKRQAKEAGQQAVTRDDQGNIQVQRAPIIGDAAIVYENAMKTEAVAVGEGAVKEKLLQARHEFKDDPESFRKAADAYTKGVETEYTKAGGTAVGRAVGRIAQNTAREFHEGLLNQKETRDLQRSAAAIQVQIDTAKNELFALAAGGDTSSPAYMERLQKVGALWGQLSQNPRLAIPKERVDFEIGHLNSELALASAGFRIAKVQQEKGPEAALAEANKILTDPSLNLKPQERFTFHTRLVQSIEGASRARERADTRVIADIDKAAKDAAEGYPLPPQQMGQLRSVVEQSKNPELSARLNELETVAPIIADWRKASPAQLESNLVELDRTMQKTGRSPAMLQLQKSGTEMLKKMRDGIKTDPLGWADRTGAVPVAPINWGDTATLDAQLRDRAVAAEAVGKHYGIRPDYLRPEEQALLQAATAQGGQAMTSVAAAIVSGFGDRAPRVLSEISKESPVLAHIGGLMQSNGSPSLVRDAADAVALRQNKDLKIPEPKTAEILAQEQRRAEVYGGAFFLAGETGRAAEKTAQSAFYTRAYRQGYDRSLAGNDEGKATFDRSLQEAAGATYSPTGTRFGGIANYGTKPGTWFQSNKVLIPGNIRADRFNDVVGALKDEDVGGKWQSFGKTYGVKDVQAAVPVAVRGGYRFAVGDPMSDNPKWVPDANGRPLVLDLERLEPALRKRVPQAYAGQ